MMIIDNKFDIGDLVYCITDKEQQPRLITVIQITQSGLKYFADHGPDGNYYYDFQLSLDKNIMLTSTN